MPVGGGGGILRDAHELADLRFQRLAEAHRVRYTAVVREIQSLRPVREHPVDGRVELLRVELCWRGGWRDKRAGGGIELTVGNAECVSGEDIRVGEVEAAATDKLMPLFKSDNRPIHPYRVAYELNQFLADNTVYIGDGGDVVTISAQAVRPRRPGQWMDPGPLGSLGVGTGFAIDAGLAHPDGEVLCYYGDGAFGMTAFDMETANRFGVPYIAVIGNNSAMNQIRYGQLAKYGKQRGNVGSLLGNVPFSKFAEMLGGYGEEVREPAQIAPALRRARESVQGHRRSAVINIWVDPREYAPGTKNQTMYK